MTIAEIADLIKETVGFEGNLVYDKTKPDGTPLKLMDVSRINALGWKAKTNLKEGLKIAYNDFSCALELNLKRKYPKKNND